MSSTPQLNGDKKVAVHAEKHADVIIEEMVPHQPFLQADCPSHGESWFRSAFRSLLETPVLEEVETVRTSGSPRHKYRVDPGAVREARAVRDNREPYLPCGHAGLSNVRGTGYECGYEGCDQRFVRDGSDAFAEVAVDG